MREVRRRRIAQETAERAGEHEQRAREKAEQDLATQRLEAELLKCREHEEADRARAQAKRKVRSEAATAGHASRKQKAAFHSSGHCLGAQFVDKPNGPLKGYMHTSEASCVCLTP